MLLRLWFLILCVLVGAFAPSRAGARGSETRTWVFAPTTTETRLESEPQAAGTHQENGLWNYEHAPGCSLAAENAARLALPAPRSAKTWRNTPGIAFGSGHKIGDRWIHQGRVGFVPEEVAAGLRGRQFEKFDDFQEAFWKQVGEHPRLMAEFSPSNQGLIRRGQAPFAIPSQQTGGGAANMRFNLHHLKKIESGGSVYDIDNIVIASPYHHLNAFHR